MYRMKTRYLIVLVACAIGRVSGAEPTTKSTGVPPDLAAAWEIGDQAATLALVTDRLRAHLGEAFPDLRLHGDRKSTRFSKILAGRTVVFLAGTDWKGSLEMAKRFRAAGWRYPGYDHVVTLVIDPVVPLLRKELPSLEAAFLTEWPLPSYLAYCRIYPSLFFISAEGTFEGFQVGATSPVFANASDGTAK